MNSNVISLKVAGRSVAAASLILAVIFALALPAFSYAASYAYVNAQGEVRSVTADNANAALLTAPGIHIHSGVMLLDSQADQDVVGDKVVG